MYMTDDMSMNRRFPSRERRSVCSVLVWYGVLLIARILEKGDFWPYCRPTGIRLDLDELHAKL